MSTILYESSIKYEAWVKILLGVPVALMVAMGVIFYRFASAQQGISAEAARDFQVASIVLFATGPFLLLIYWLVLPTKITVYQDKIRIKYGQFYWNVRFETIEAFQPAQGIPPVRSNSSVTSYRNQIEIVRTKKMNIRLSPDNRDQFLDRANRALADWKRNQLS
jgi:hypothetical protein